MFNFSKELEEEINDSLIKKFGVTYEEFCSLDSSDQDKLISDYQNPEMDFDNYSSANCFMTDGEIEEEKNIYFGSKIKIK